jgi:hypothetical protein
LDSVLFTATRILFEVETEYKNFLKKMKITQNIFETEICGLNQICKYANSFRTKKCMKLQVIQVCNVPTGPRDQL